MKKKIFIYIILCILCFVAGLKFSNNNKLALTDYEYVNNTKIIIEDNVNIDIANQYIENFKTMPEFLSNNCSTIVITNEDLNKKFNFNFNNKVLAVTIDDTIYINDEKFKSNVIIHELFHVYDYKNNWISLSEEFSSIYDLEKDIIKVSPGNNQNKQEFFATIGTEYFTNQNDLKQLAPQSNEFLNKLLATD
jgi:hypothetical protein